MLLERLIRSGFPWNVLGLLGVAGVALAATKFPLAAQWLDQHGGWIGTGMAVAAMLVTWMLYGRRR